MDQSATSFREEEERDLRAALQFTVDKICASDGNDADDDSPSGGTAMSRSAVKALTELAFQYATTSLSNDLVWFSRHANRRTITVDDVKLVARKNPNHLLSQLESFAEQRKVARGVHTMEAVEKERNHSKSPKKPQRKAAANKTKKATSGRKKAPSLNELRRKEARERIMNEVNGSDSSDNSMMEIKPQEIDTPSSESDSSGLPMPIGKKKKDKNTFSLQRDPILDNSSSSDDDDLLKGRESHRSLKRLKLGKSQETDSRMKSASASTSALLKHDDLSDTESDDSSIRGIAGNDKENTIKSQNSVEVLEVQSQDFEY